MNQRFTLLLLLAALFCFCQFGYAQQSSKTIHQTFTMDGAEKIVVNVVGSNVEMRETKGSRILCEITVKLTVANDKLLDFVCNSGRYDLEKTLDAATGELTLASKKSNNVIMVKGEECREELHYVFYIPATVKFANNSTIQGISKD